jgi:hypothetical protein
MEESHPAHLQKVKYIDATWMTYWKFLSFREKKVQIQNNNVCLIPKNIPWSTGLSGRAQAVAREASPIPARSL